MLSFREDCLLKVHVKDISSAHLISYHPDRDLLPMILYVLSFRENSLPKVHVKDISSAHLISYHPDRDLLPMVLANCNYSFEVGQGTKVDYNVTNLERQLMDRFLFSKSIINEIQQVV
jgi:hypothetical protein